jgi:hypothetical protein
MRHAVKSIVLLVSITAVFATGCSLAVFVRVFNRTDHTIRLLGTGGDAPTDIPAGGSARVFLSSITHGRDHGFAVQDGDGEQFYVASRHAADGRLDYPYSLSFPPVSRKSKGMAPEYFVEYAGDSLIFALDASDEQAPKRLNPQPTGFPLKPNKAPEPPPGSVTSRAY